MYLKGRAWLEEKTKVLELAPGLIPETFIIENGKWKGREPPQDHEVDKLPWFAGLGPMQIVALVTPSVGKVRTNIDIVHVTTLFHFGADSSPTHSSSLSWCCFPSPFRFMGGAGLLLLLLWVVLFPFPSLEVEGRRGGRQRRCSLPFLFLWKRRLSECATASCMKRGFFLLLCCVGDTGDVFMMTHSWLIGSGRLLSLPCCLAVEGTLICTFQLATTSVVRGLSLSLIIGLCSVTWLVKGPSPEPAGLDFLSLWWCCFPSPSSFPVMSLFSFVCWEWCRYSSTFALVLPWWLVLFSPSPSSSPSRAQMRIISDGYSLCSAASASARQIS